MMPFSTASATSQMNRSPLACRRGNKCSSGLEVSVAIVGIFGVSHTVSSRFGVSNTASGFQIPVKRFGVSHTELRGFEYPHFGVSDTRLRGFKYRAWKFHKAGEGL